MTQPPPIDVRVAAAKAGDADAWAAVYDELFPCVWRYVAGRVGGDRAAAEDVVQESFLALVKALPGYLEEGRFFGFAFAVVRQRLAAHYRAAGRTPAPAPEGLAERLLTDELPEELLQKEETREFVRRALATLEPRHREALTLRFGEGLKFAEVGVRMGLQEGGAKSLVLRAKEALRVALKVEAGPLPGDK